MTELRAKEGHVYTNGVIYSKQVFLSNLDSPDNWEEITDEEALARQMTAEMGHEMF